MKPIHIRRLGLLGLLLGLFWFSPALYARNSFQINEDRGEAQFPGSVTFHLDVSGQAKIDNIELEYGAVQSSCGTASSKVRPEFEPGSTVTVSWTWDMRKSGSLPPGTTLWWRWRITDAGGQQTATGRQEMVLADPRYDWQEQSSAELVLFSATAEPEVSQALWQAAHAALDQLEQEIGHRPAGTIKIYNYPTSEELREAVLYAQSWTGGMAFTRHNTLLLGVNAGNLDWGLRAMAHELTHIIVHQVTANCGGDLPTWLDEGLAMYMEGDLSEEEQALFDQAVTEDELHSLRSLSSSFPTDGRRAALAYAQSNQVVAYLLETYGPEKMSQLLDVFQAGSGYDQALETVYGLDTQTLDNEWRVELGLSPRQVATAASPTPVPTLALVSANPPTATPGPQPTVAPTPTATATRPVVAPVVAARPQTNPPPATAGNWQELIPGAGVVILILVVIGGALIWRRRV